MRERFTFEREMRDLGLMEFSLHKLKHVILVAGYDYSRQGVSFERICLNRMKLLLEKNARLRFKFTLFNVQSGEVKVYENVRSTDTRRQLEEKGKVIDDRFCRITSANFTGKVFNKNQSGVMSIMDIYKYIQSIGEKEPRTIMELSFFSHGWMGGPILVNSSEREEFKGVPDRDPNDKDPRTNKDFSPPNMGIQQLNFFRNAFNSNGFIWIWGCAFTQIYHQVLHRLLKNPNYKKDGSQKDEDVFRFEFNQQWANTYFRGDPNFFPSKVEGKFPLRFERKFSEIKEFFRRGLNVTYSSYIAKSSGVKCYGALLGTYSDYEKGVELPLMVIPHRGIVSYRKNYPYSDDFTGYINFYKTYLGITIDPENRGYGTYFPSSNSS